MGNLGAYQDIVVKAKDAGGVEMLIESIEKSAAMKAMPKAFVAGVGVTAAAALGVTAMVKRYSKRSDAQEAEAIRAKAALRGDAPDSLVEDAQPSDVDEGGEVNVTSEQPAEPDDNA
ncbi:hypothetical protein FXB39_10395 [Nocardioides sp. BGMRC 2183]|nr:hypothetical protein FXB39_10395 [Nocardioides sp. BGMRC 2183]